MFSMQEPVSIDAKEKLRKLILNHGLKWNEGLTPNEHIPKWIFDLREVILTPEGSKLASMLIYEKIKDLDFDMIGGLSIAAEPLVTSLIMHFYNESKNVPGFIIRKQPNNFGLRKKIEGPIVAGKRVVLVDDVLNFGTKMFRAITASKEEDCIIVKIIILLDFCKSGNKKLIESGYNVDYIYNLHDFGLEKNSLYNYKRIINLTESNITDRKESLLKKLNEILNEEISDFIEYKNLLLVAYKNGYIYCYNQNNYSIKWGIKLGESISTPIVLDDNVTIISAYSGLKRAILFFISVNDGTVLKDIKIKGKINSAPILYKDICLLGSDDKKLYCISRTNYNILWTFETNGPIKTNPVIDENAEIIYLSSSDGNIYVLNLNGVLIWKKYFGKINTPLLIYEDKILINSSIDVIFCIDKNDGNLNWFFRLKNKAFDIKIIFGKLVVGCEQGYLLFLDILNGKISDCFKIANESVKEICEYNNRLLVKLKNGKYYFIKA